MGIMNVASYAFTIFASHLLGPRDYGGVASLMGLLLVVNVVALGLQATGARRIAAAPQQRAEIERSLMTATYRSAVALGILCLAFTPLISSSLSLDDWAAAAMIGVSIVPLTIMGGQAGVLQGEERWGALSAVYLGMGVGRIAFAAALMPAISSTFGAMLAVAIGAWVPALIGAIALRRRRGPEVAATGTVTGAGQILREVSGNSYALLAFFALSNLDVVMARNLLDEHEAGLYAGGLILTKAVLFLPQFVVVIAFPAMASAGLQRTYVRGLAAVGAIGAITTLGAVVMSALAVTFIGGTDYRDVQPDVWLFATLGTLLALVQLMVYEVVARQHRGAVLIVWAGLVCVAGLARTADGFGDLVRLVALVNLGVLGALLVVVVRDTIRRGRTAGTA